MVTPPPPCPLFSCGGRNAGEFVAGDRNEVAFREIPSHILERVCTYFYYKVRYTNSNQEIPEFTIQPDEALELLMAANFLDP